MLGIHYGLYFVSIAILILYNMVCLQCRSQDYDQLSSPSDKGVASTPDIVLRDFGSSSTSQPEITRIESLDLEHGPQHKSSSVSGYSLPSSIGIGPEDYLEQQNLYPVPNLVSLDLEHGPQHNSSPVSDYSLPSSIGIGPEDYLEQQNLYPAPNLVLLHHSCRKLLIESLDLIWTSAQLFICLWLLIAKQHWHWSRRLLRTAKSISCCKFGGNLSTYFYFYFV
ncbi:hypothetical protein DsansV1_C23g0175321 [Dioscorea sansibarensis]